jgi:hypothetical protein
MSVRVPDALVDALVSGLITPPELAIYVKACSMMKRGKLEGSMHELSARIGVRRQYLIESLKRLSGLGVLVYEPSNNRYTPSVIGLPKRTDARESIGPNSDTDESSIGLPKRTDAAGNTASELGESASVSQNGPMSAQKEGLKDIRDKVKRKPFMPDSEPFRLSARLLDLIRTNLDPKASANIQSWAVELDRLHRIDKRDYEEIERVIEWLHDSNAGADAAFWRGNVVSAANLRKHFPRLVVKMNGYRPARHLDESLAEFERLG